MGHISDIVETYLFGINETFRALPIDCVAKVVEIIDRARSRDKKVLIFGNGGSAATASHIACDLSKGTLVGNNHRLRAISLCDNMPLLSAWANDTAFENVFSEQLANLVDPGDVVIAISGSGNSSNVINGIRTARDRDAATIGFIGFDGGLLKDLVDVPVVIENHCMEQVEDIHLLLGHIITVCLRSKLKAPAE